MKNEKTELKWYEKKAGLKIKDKINTEEKRKKRKSEVSKKTTGKFLQLNFPQRKALQQLNFLIQKVCFHHQQFHRMQKT